ncbi:MAG: VOC family protein [Candidatus Eremiobacteraeota bacterium]|nr:VOC family protein [Candidatus Eremiobacteraeota bacterium]
MADNPFVHVELVTQDLARSKSFYGALFDWDLEEAEGGYTMVRVGEHGYGVGGGMLTAPHPDIPPHWMPYVGVADLKAATEKAKSLGATVIKDITPIEGYGAFSIIKDPAGAVLGLYKSE